MTILDDSELNIIHEVCYKYDIHLYQVTSFEHKEFMIPLSLRNMYKYYAMDNKSNVIFMGSINSLRAYCIEIEKGKQIEPFNFFGRILCQENLI